MADLLESDRKKIEIMEALSDGKVYSYYLLSKRVGTNYETVKKNCRFLELLNFIEVTKVGSGESASGKASYRVKITNKGLDWLKKLTDW